MKIAFIVRTFPALSETFILNQITGLIDLGHSVDIYAGRTSGEDIVHERVREYHLIDRTHYIRIPQNRWARIIKGICHIITNFHKKPKIILNSLNFVKHGKKALSLYLLLIAAHFTKRYDIVHCHFGPNGNIGVLLKDVGAITGKVITTFHGADISSYIKKRGDHVYEKLFRTGDLFLPISNHWKEKLIKLGSPLETTIVHRMGIDVRRFNFARNKVLINGKVSILTVARLVEKKGVEYGIRALAKLIKRFPNVEYNIAGDGPLYKNLNIMIDNLNLKNNINLLGWKNQDEISDLMECSNILLAPSVTGKDGDQEGIPVVLMEAMARGLPVISTFHSGIPELVLHGETGLLAQERDIEALVQNLESLIVHSELREHLRQRARKYVENHYDINKLNVRLIEIYEQILN
jgi:colanic acid/amylovoran/stewartan biosynthesis glycosyltransferase WcaL/AmsK/CpsK